MIRFVNAKINLGLDIVRKREDGYHDLSTVFYPVGIHSGTPEDAGAFCDIMEVVVKPEGAPGGDEFILRGRRVDCPLEKNLFYRAATEFASETVRAGRTPLPSSVYILEKHLPDGAGLGGGSADAGMLLAMLNEMLAERDGEGFPADAMIGMAARLGADCPFFIITRCCYASGIGERLEPMALDLSGKWIVIAKPDLHISTKEAFAGVRPRQPEFDLRKLPELPLEEWRHVVKNDFEESLFPNHPVLGRLKEMHYCSGALFSLMSGSGSSVYGIYEDMESGGKAAEKLRSTVSAVWLLSL